MIAERTKHPLPLLAALLLALALLTGCGSSGSKKAIQQLQLGQQYLTGQNYTEAAAAFTEVLRLAPDNLPAYLGRAQAYAGLEQYDDAKTDYTSVIEKASSRPYTQAQAYAGRGDIWTLLGDPAQARSDYDLALQVLDGIDLSSVSDSVQENVKALTEQVQNALTTLDDGTTANVENGGEDQFQQILDAIELPSEYASCKRYLLVNDYDADGREEAFGLVGIPDTTYFSLDLAKLYIYFISPEGQVTTVYDPSSDSDETSKLYGWPKGMTSFDQTDFSECYLTNGGPVYAQLYVHFPEEGPGYGLALGMIDGQPVAMDAPTNLNPATESFFVGNEFDDVMNVYAVMDGSFEKIGVVACAAMNERFTDINAPEDAWKKYESSIRQWLKQTDPTVPDTLTSRVIPGDYDGDGRQEAYAILQAPEDEIGTHWARIYYISPNGYIFQYTRGYGDTEPLFGYLRDSDKADPLLSAGNQKFLLWELDGGGSGSATRIFGVRNGLPYEPEVSGSYQFFQQSGSGYTGMLSDFSQGYHDYIERSLTFNAASGEFQEK